MHMALRYLLSMIAGDNVLFETEAESVRHEAAIERALSEQRGFTTTAIICKPKKAAGACPTIPSRHGLSRTTFLCPESTRDLAGSGFRWGRQYTAEVQGKKEPLAVHDLLV